MLQKLRHQRAIRTIATVLRDNLSPADCHILPSTKVLCGIVFAISGGNKELHRDLRRCAARLCAKVSPATIAAVERFAGEEIDFTGGPIVLSDTALKEAGADLTLADRRVLLFARAASTSPARLTPPVLGGMEEVISAQGMVELMVWLAVVQMMHRLYVFYIDPEVAATRMTASGYHATDRLGRASSDRQMSPSHSSAKGDSRSTGTGELAEDDFNNELDLLSANAATKMTGADAVKVVDPTVPVAMVGNKEDPSDLGSSAQHQLTVLRVPSGTTPVAPNTRLFVDEDASVSGQMLETGSINELANARERRRTSLPPRDGAAMQFSTSSNRQGS